MQWKKQRIVILTSMSDAAWLLELNQHYNDCFESSLQDSLVPKAFWNIWQESRCSHHVSFLGWARVERSTVKHAIKWRVEPRLLLVEYIWQLTAVQVYKRARCCYIYSLRSAHRPASRKAHQSDAVRAVWIQTISPLLHCTATANICLNTAC